jgi:hypothetical protein
MLVKIELDELSKNQTEINLVRRTNSKINQKTFIDVVSARNEVNEMYNVCNTYLHKEVDEFSNDTLLIQFYKNMIPIPFSNVFLDTLKSQGECLKVYQYHFFFDWLFPSLTLGGIPTFDQISAQQFQSDPILQKNMIYSFCIIMTHNHIYVGVENDSIIIQTTKYKYKKEESEEKYEESVNCFRQIYICLMMVGLIPLASALRKCINRNFDIIRNENDNFSRKNRLYEFPPPEISTLSEEATNICILSRKNSGTNQNIFRDSIDNNVEINKIHEICSAHTVNEKELEQKIVDDNNRIGGEQRRKTITFDEGKNTTETYGVLHFETLKKVKKRRSNKRKKKRTRN